MKRSAIRRACGSTSAAGSTALAMPQSTASWPVKGSPNISFSAARRWPMRAGTTRLAANSGTKPKLAKGMAKRASSAT